MVDIRVLEQLKEFKNQKSLSQAARVLNLSQPALSQSMKKLEQELGISLFDRWSKNRMKLNENGEKVVEYANQILALQKELLEFARQETKE